MSKDYTISQAEILNHTRIKVAELFDTYPVPAHSFDHAERVSMHARAIAKGEKSKNIFLAELVGLLHDIGRIPEKYNPKKRRMTHHELSYEMLQEWFNQDTVYDALTKEEKLALLYAVRYHWNNVADEYEIAWILRDADKIDMFGQIGVERAREHAEDEKAFQMGMRLKYDALYWVHTKTAKAIIKERKLIEQIDEFYKEFLKDKIEPVVL